MTNAERQAAWRARHSDRLKRARQAFNAALAGAGTVPEPAVDPVPVGLSGSAQQKLDAYKRQLERNFDERVRQAAMAWVHESRIPMYEKKLGEIERLFSTTTALMKRAEYNAVVKCLHQDTMNARTEAELAEAFQIFTRLKLRLINDEEERRAARSTLPRNVDELLKRRQRKR